MRKSIITSIVSIAVLIIIVGTLSFFSIAIASKVKKSRNLLYSTIAYYSSEGGIEDAALRVKNEMSYNPSYTLEFSNADVEIQVNTIASKEKEIIAIATGPDFVKRKIRIVLAIDSTAIEFHYGAQVGKGGVVMLENSIIDGSIYSNGSIIGANGARITGDVFVASGMSLDQEFAIYNSDYTMGQSSPYLDTAQSFKPSSSGLLSMVSLYIKKVGKPGDRTVKILTDNGGSPSKTVLASGTLYASKVTSNFGWIEISFPSPPSLLAGQTYWIMVDNSSDNNKYYIWGGDNGENYLNGSAKYSPNWNASNPTWYSYAADLDFKTYLGGLPTFIKNVTVGEQGSGDAHAHSMDDVTVARDAYASDFSDGTVGRDLYTKTASDCTVGRNLYYEVSSSCSVGGQVIQQAAPSDPPVIAMPISDANIEKWKQEAESGGTYNDPAHCSPPDGAIIGPAKLNCDFAVSNGKKITIAGTIWVKGNISLSNNAVLQLSSEYGDLSGVIVAENPDNPIQSGLIWVSNGVFICGSSGYNEDTNHCNDSQGSYLMLLSNYSGSLNAITINNNVEGGIFYSAKGATLINNNTIVKEVTAYSLSIANNAELVYESGLLNAQFSKGPSAGWVLKSWDEE